MNAILIIVALVVFFPLFGIIMGSIFDNAEKQADKGNGSCLGTIFIAVAIAIVIMTIVELKNCSNSNYERNWEPRHTQLVNPDLKNVNILIFTSCKA